MAKRSARIIDEIPETQSMDFSRPIVLKGDKTIVKTLTLTSTQLLGIDRLNVVCCNMAYARASFTHVIDLAYLPIGAAIGFVNGSPNDQAGVEQVHESVLTALKSANGDVTLTWSRSAYLSVNTDAYTTTTTSSGYGIVGVYGYQSFNLLDTLLKSEIEALIAGRLAIANKLSFVTIGSATTGANGTQYPRSNWSSSIVYIGDTTVGGYGVLCGTLQCNANPDTLANAVKANTIYGFAPYQTASIRMVGHGTSASEDIWYGADGNNTIILNNSGQNRTYTQYASNTFAIPCQKKY